MSQAELSRILAVKGLPMQSMLVTWHEALSSASPALSWARQPSTIFAPSSSWARFSARLFRMLLCIASPPCVVILAVGGQKEKENMLVVGFSGDKHCKIVVDARLCGLLLRECEIGQHICIVRMLSVADARMNTKVASCPGWWWYGHGFKCDVLVGPSGGKQIHAQQGNKLLVKSLLGSKSASAEANSGARHQSQCR